MRSCFRSLTIAAVSTLAMAGLVRAESPAAARMAILDGYAAAARQTDPAFPGFSSAAGQAFFLARPAAGQPATPSCTTCHTTSPLNAGQTRAGKVLGPMAVSRTPGRFTDATKVERWFTRNCRSVYGRLCTPREKGDFITFMAGL